MKLPPTTPKQQDILIAQNTRTRTLAATKSTFTGKQRLKRFGKVDIPAEAFTVMLKRD
jgi:translation elongation factor EF-4